jgi:hypothetical protein
MSRAGVYVLEEADLACFVIGRGSLELIAKAAALEI